MNNETNLIEKDIHAYLKQHENKQLLRLLTCGSVDDGKSTLIGRLLHDSKMIFEDHLAALTVDSKKMGTTGEKLDLALLVDGLQSEREQGITIDVAYRYFSTEKRKFIIADTPGHEQYTRNMATGASTCDLAIILIDARYGVQTQTKRHSFIVSLLGIKHIVVAINKMDLVDYSEERYNEIKQDYANFAKSIGLKDINYTPISALNGDNVVQQSDNMSWYKDQPLMPLLETIEISKDKDFANFRLPVQYVNRPNLDFRGFCGTIAAGTINVGDEVIALPSKKTSKVASIVTFDGDLNTAYPGQAITLTLEDEIDVSRGDVLTKPGMEPLQAKSIKAKLIWMAEEGLSLKKTYDFKLATQTSSGKVSKVAHRIDVNTLEHNDAETLALNEIGEVNISLEKPFIFDNYQFNQTTGAFIVIDRLTNVTVGAGMIDAAADENSDVGTTANEVNWPEFELELNQLVRKHFPHWEAKDITKL
ncbi:sulfate adenylyltransferase subunit CysN [Flocculibacter collagenilyticus]|uniref:sulfate adenylyltransferase subunit CysN n=1 Tax=Flocculibacter collagenilyticus TaxID=2744479 RepID=UPI0018F32274|nr:sulfate adenylyltransferase subunit CysN [Flocculibacter collagenilyticus]